MPTAFQVSKCVRGGLKRREYQVKAPYQVRANPLLPAAGATLVRLLHGAPPLIRIICLLVVLGGGAGLAAPSAIITGWRQIGQLAIFPIASRSGLVHAIWRLWRCRRSTDEIPSERRSYATLDPLLEGLAETPSLADALAAMQRGAKVSLLGLFRKYHVSIYTYTYIYIYTYIHIYVYMYICYVYK